MQTSQTYFSVALPLPLRKCFDYLPPHDLFDTNNADIKPGCRVRVQFGNQQLVGVIVDLHSTPSVDPASIKPIIEILDTSPVIPASLISLCRWSANYYQYSLGEAINGAIPISLRKGKTIPSRRTWRLTTEGLGLPKDGLKRSPKQQEALNILLEKKTLPEGSPEVKRPILTKMLEKGLVELTTAEPNDSLPEQLLKEAPLRLNDEQDRAVKSVRFHHYASYLLHGITGSGKTEVYLQLIHRVLETGNSVLVLVPEIGLTHQTIERINKRFNLEVAELHSSVSEVKRTENWQDARDGHARIIVGTRLAAFTPIPKLGLIVIDEEHDASYKQQDGLRYSARDLCVYLAHQRNIPVILGSATPSLETLHNVNQGRYTRLTLSQRAGEASPPKLTLIDLKAQKLHAGLSEHAISKMGQTLAQGNQTLVFINRRGYAPAMQCHDCGWMSQCPRCSSSMTVHKLSHTLHCHHCDYQVRLPHECPSCNSQQLITTGLGTEQTEEFLIQRFPDFPVYRLDRDSTRQKGALQSQLEHLRKGDPGIIVATQMMAKGHHLPNLTQVIITDLDQGLFSPEFRGAERMGQLLTQVSGRAGREGTPGEVLIQTHHPQHPLLDQLLNDGFERFAGSLLEERYLAQMPPIWSMATFRAESKRADNAVAMLNLVKAILAEIHPYADTLKYLGPMPDRIERINERYRFVLEVKAQQRSQLMALLKEGIERIDQQALAKRTRWSLDVDPS